MANYREETNPPCWAFLARLTLDQIADRTIPAAAGPCVWLTPSREGASRYVGSSRHTGATHISDSRLSSGCIEPIVLYNLGSTFRKQLEAFIYITKEPLVPKCN